MARQLLRRTLNGSLLGQMLDDPQLAPQLRALPAPVLRQVILQIGLEDAGELVALSSLEQLREVFDEDLWRSPRPGQDDAFDAARFCTWLEVLLEAGDAFVADRLAELSEDFLVFAFSRLLRALDTAEVAASITDDDEAGLIDKVLEAEACQELGDYLIVARIENGWDAVWTTLVALDDRHPELLRAVLHRCWLATREQAEGAGGLYEVLTGEEQLLEDARAEREERRAARGYVSPADARAFLGLARRAPAEPETDPITRAYFRELRPVPVAPGLAGGGARPSRSAPLRRLLAEAGVVPAPEDAPPPEDSLFRSTATRAGRLRSAGPPARRRGAGLPGERARGRRHVPGLAAGGGGGARPRALRRGPARGAGAGGGRRSGRRRGRPWCAGAPSGCSARRGPRARLGSGARPGARGYSLVFWLRCASMSRFSSSGVSFGRSIVSVILSILPLKANGTW